MPPSDEQDKHKWTIIKRTMMIFCPKVHHLTYLKCGNRKCHQVMNKKSHKWLVRTIKKTMIIFCPKVHLFTYLKSGNKGELQGEKGKKELERKERERKERNERKNRIRKKDKEKEKGGFST